MLKQLDNIIKWGVIGAALLTLMYFGWLLPLVVLVIDLAVVLAVAGAFLFVTMLLDDKREKISVELLWVRGVMSLGEWITGLIALACLIGGFGLVVGHFLHYLDTGELLSYYPTIIEPLKS